MPIRVVVVTTQQDVGPPRLLPPGHPDFGVATIVHPVGHTTTVTQIDQPGAGRRKHLCGSLAAKAAAGSAAFAQMLKEAFGLARQAANGEVKILPFLGAPMDRPLLSSIPSAAIARPSPSIVSLKAVPTRIVLERPYPSAMPIPAPTHHKHKHHPRPNFLSRVDHALVSLGGWEGGIVAFVLGAFAFLSDDVILNTIMCAGCGIGVIFRMIFVLGLVLVRSFRGRKEEVDTPDQETVLYDAVVLFDTAEDQPPQYTAPTDFPDEKKEAQADNSKH